MNKIKITILATVLISLSACSSTPKQEFADCTFPDAPKEAAPQWVCGIPAEGYALSAVGSTAKSSAGFNYMKEQAVAAARVDLAQQLQAQVGNRIQQYVETTGQGKKETVDQVRNSVTSILTNQTLIGSKMINTRTSSNGDLYVLVVLDDTAAMENTKTALRTSMNNDEALWQQFKAKQSFESLADEIANLN